MKITMEKMLFFCLFWWWKGVIFELYDIFNYHHQYKQKCNTYDYFIMGGFLSGGLLNMITYFIL
jgi:hypothetical protein